MVRTALPEVLWAQRSSSSDTSKNYVFLTIAAPRVSKKDLQLDLKSRSLAFTGTSETEKCKYHVELEFYAEVDPAESKMKHTERDIEVKLQKKELSGEYWPRLLKDSGKVSYLKTDFDKWVDEDDDTVDTEDFSQFKGMSLPATSGDFGNIDFSKLSGGSNTADNGDSSDEDMPAMEEEAEKKKA